MHWDFGSAQKENQLSDPSEVRLKVGKWNGSIYLLEAVRYFCNV